MDVYIKSILEGSGRGGESCWSWEGEEKEEEEEVVVMLMEDDEEEWRSKRRCETLESVVAGVSKSNCNSKGGRVEAQTIAARARRRNINEKMRELESLIPSPSRGGKSKKRVESVKMLEEAIKYVSYLKAQLEVLECLCNFPLAGTKEKERLGFLLMSPAIQSNLYTHQCCLCVAHFTD
ncbi:hypothetical protein SUGI_0927190 [Cryptomeria japonica]|nr:hypothetical protein SUGI_0927190 [Cryptomeria japonica]